MYIITKIQNLNFECEEIEKEYKKDISDLTKEYEDNIFQYKHLYKDYLEMYFKSIFVSYEELESYSFHYYPNYYKDTIGKFIFNCNNKNEFTKNDTLIKDIKSVINGIPTLILLELGYYEKQIKITKLVNNIEIIIL